MDALLKKVRFLNNIIYLKDKVYLSICFSNTQFKQFDQMKMFSCHISVLLLTRLEICCVIFATYSNQLRKYLKKVGDFLSCGKNIKSHFENENELGVFTLVGSFVVQQIFKRINFKLKCYYE